MLRTYHLTQNRYLLSKTSSYNVIFQQTNLCKTNKRHKINVECLVSKKHFHMRYYNIRPGKLFSEWPSAFQ